MKKYLLIFAVLIAGSPFVSCKKMKDDIKDLKNQVNELQKENDTLKNSLGSDEPIAATTTFEDDNGATRTVSGVYKFKGSDLYTQSLVKISDTAYDVYIERYSQGGGEGASVEFTYNPATKAVKNVEGSHYWRDADDYTDRVRYYGTYTGLTKNLTIDSLNITTGAISLKFSAAGTSAYTSAVSYSYTPNQGKPVATNFSFVGKLKLFTRN
jgi:hypothetical protein